MTYLDLNLKDDHCFYDDVKDICVSFLKIIVYFHKLNFCGSTVPVRSCLFLIIISDRASVCNCVYGIALKSHV